MQRFYPKDSTSIYAAIALLSTAIFISERYTALGIAVWVFYLAPMMLTLFTWRPAAPPVLAALLTALTTAGFLISPPGMNPTIASINRAFGIAIIWIAAGFAWYFIRGKLAVQRQKWLQTGQTHLNQKMAGDQTLEQLGGNILRFLAEYLDAQAGAIFIKENGSFNRFATYAMSRLSGDSERFAPGEGLLGQCVKDSRTFVVNDVPDGYLSIGSGLGKSRPSHLLIAPAIVDGVATAVLEFGFFHAIDDAATELMERASSTIAIRVRTVKHRAQLEELLEETQRQAEELQAQSEELRVYTEELEKQGAVLKDSQSRLEQQQTELEESNAQLEEQSQLLETQRDEVVRANAFLEAQAKEIEQASRYKSEFLASMSHELRTPLNSALILARLLFENRSGNLTPEQVEYARSIEASGNALLELINDVLDLAKVESGRMEVRAQHVSISKLADTLRSTFQPLARQKKLAFEIHIASDAPAMLETDPQRVEQVLKNLLSNAVKFTERGEITLDIGRSGNDRVVFSVHDTGIGIPEEQRQIVFEPFRQGEGALNRKYGGTGLGLSISRQLARLLGGEIQLESAVGRGSTFTLLLPERFEAALVMPETEDRPKAASAAAGASNWTDSPVVFSEQALPAPLVDDDRAKLNGAQRIILIVEDDEVFAYILRDLAHEMNFQCLVATTAAEALLLAEKYSPSAMILDVALPDNSGLSLLDRFKSDVRTRHVPIHIVSAHDYSETALSLGAVGYILKPVKREQLVGAFHLLENRLSQRLRRVLVVEDDPVQRESLRGLLASREVETSCVSTATECLERLKASVFDCMVLDLSLPDASGLSLLETISREDRYSFPPVIVYTARELTAGEEQTLRRYSKSIIIKGAKSPERLLDEVTLFLHQVVSELSPEQQRMLQKARSRDSVLDGRRILMVEDDVRNVFALSSLLEPHGVKLQIARNGHEALEALEKSTQNNGPGVDLVLMDIMMPEMDGLTAIRHIRKRAAWTKLPIVALTAKAMKGDQEQAIAAGANDYVAKPIDVDQFLSVVRVWMPR